MHRVLSSPDLDGKQDAAATSEMPAMAAQVPNPLAEGEKEMKPTGRKRLKAPRLPFWVEIRLVFSSILYILTVGDYPIIDSSVFLPVSHPPSSCSATSP